MIELIIAAALIGPPMPRAQTQMVSAYDEKLEQIKKTADGTMTDAAIIGVCSAFDVWATERCISRNPNCYEANSLGKDSGTQRLAVKAAMYPVKVGLVYLLRRLNHHNWARGAAVVVGSIDIGFGVHALNKSRK